MTNRKNAALLMSRARNLAKANPSVWGFMVGLALNEAAHERTFGFQWLVEEARRRYLIDDTGSDFKLDNDYCAPLGRLLLEEHPEVGPYLRRRHAAVDDLEEAPGTGGEGRGA